MHALRIRATGVVDGFVVGREGSQTHTSFVGNVVDQVDVLHHRRVLAAAAVAVTAPVAVAFLDVVADYLSGYFRPVVAAKGCENMISAENK